MNKQFSLFDSHKTRHFPTTRYQGSKRKLLSSLEEIFKRYSFNKAIDLFSGSGSVSYLLRSMEKKVVANDYLKYNANTASVFLSAFSNEDLKYAQEKLSKLLEKKPAENLSAVRDNFRNIFFTDDENREIDYFCGNLKSENERLRPIYIYAVGQALLKKRPYNLFHRANLEMRTKDVKRSFGNKKTWDTPILQHAHKAIDELLRLDLSSLPIGRALCENTSQLSKIPKDVDLIYMDPPYIPRKGAVVDYSDFYSFLEGLVDYELFKNPIKQMNHKPLVSFDTAWNHPDRAIEQLRQIAERWKKSIIIFSYRNDGAITASEIEDVFRSVGRSATSETVMSYKYALAHSEESSEIVICSNSFAHTDEMPPNRLMKSVS